MPGINVTTEIELHLQNTPKTHMEDPYGLLSGCDQDTYASQLQVATDWCRADDRMNIPRVKEGARSGDECPECRCPLVVCEMDYVCPQCRAVKSAANIADVIPVSTPQEPGASASRGRLRIVGPDSNWFQPDLDRTNPGDRADMQMRATFAELRRLNEDYKNRGGFPFPINVLEDVAEAFSTVQQQSVKRSMMKRSIIAALLYNACFMRGFTRTRAETTEFAQLRNHGLARGDDYLRKIDEDCGLEIDMNHPRLMPHIETTFCIMNLEGAEYIPFRDAIKELVEKADELLIGTCSLLRSKVLAATCEVFSRGRKQFAATAAKCPPSDDVVCKSCKIRKNTIIRFRVELLKHHSSFVDIYKRHGFIDTRDAATNNF
jgi:hypothetical protein